MLSLIHYVIDRRISVNHLLVCARGHACGCVLAKRAGRARRARKAGQARGDWLRRRRQTFGLHIQQRVDQLHHFPESGRKVPEDKRGMYCELIAGNYRVVYRMDEDTVTTVTLIHSARMLRL